jgi:hypothetical protein
VAVVFKTKAWTAHTRPHITHVQSAQQHSTPLLYHKHTLLSIWKENSELPTTMTQHHHHATRHVLPAAITDHAAAAAAASVTTDSNR